MEYYSAIERNTFESVLMRWMNLDTEWSKSERDKEKLNPLTSRKPIAAVATVGSQDQFHHGQNYTGQQGPWPVTMTVIWSDPNYQIALNYILVSPFLYFVKNWDFRSVCLISPFCSLSRILWMKTHLSIVWMKTHLRGRTIHMVR